MEEFSLAQVDQYIDDLVTKYQSRLYNYVLSLMEEKDKNLAEDIIQDVFVRVLIIVRSKRTIIENPQAYLYAVARNCYFRISSIAKETYLSQISDTIVDNAHQPEQLFEQKERVEAVTEQLKIISQKAIQKTMSFLAQGLTIEQISEQLDLQTGTVRGYIAKGRALLYTNDEEDENIV